MSFMKHDVQYFTAWSVDTTHGTEIVPCALAAYADQLPPYLHGDVGDGVEAEKITGWFSRLSAPGYMDHTDWSGPFDTKEEAIEHLEDTYPDDEAGEGEV